MVPTTDIAKDWEPLPVHFIHDDEDLKMDPVKLGHILCTECGSSFVNSALGDGPSGYPPRCPLPGLSIVAVAALSNVAVAALSIVAVAALSNDHTCNVSCVRPHYGTRERQFFLDSTNAPMRKCMRNACTNRSLIRTCMHAC